jgi:hypothetical protein
MSNLQFSLSQLGAKKEEEGLAVRFEVFQLETRMQVDQRKPLEWVGTNQARVD